MVMRWWKRRFGGVLCAPIKQVELEHCTACGQPFNIGDLDAVLPHFEHQLALAPRPLKVSSPDEDSRSSAGTVVPFRRPVTDVPFRRRAS